jgi:flagellar hook-length control protein FliK
MDICAWRTVVTVVLSEASVARPISPTSFPGAAAPADGATVVDPFAALLAAVGATDSPSPQLSVLPLPSEAAASPGKAMPGEGAVAESEMAQTTAQAAFLMALPPELQAAEKELGLTEPAGELPLPEAESTAESDPALLPAPADAFVDAGAPVDAQAATLAQVTPTPIPSVGTPVVTADDATAESKQIIAVTAAGVPAPKAPPSSLPNDGPAAEGEGATPVAAKLIQSTSAAAAEQKPVGSPMEGEQTLPDVEEGLPALATLSSKPSASEPARIDSPASRAVEQATHRDELRPAPAGNDTPVDPAKPAPVSKPLTEEAVAPVEQAAGRPTDAKPALQLETAASEIKANPRPPISFNETANVAPLSSPPQNAQASQTSQQPTPQQPVIAHAVPVAGLAIEIAAQARNGKNRFEIRLDPPELGRIDVRLDVDKSGEVTSHLRVERAETLDLLRRDAQTLERALQQAGLRTSDSGLQFSLRDQAFAQRDPDRDLPSAAARVVVPDETLSPETQRHYGRLAGFGRGIDIRV